MTVEITDFAYTPNIFFWNDDYYNIRMEPYDATYVSMIIQISDPLTYLDSFQQINLIPISTLSQKTNFAFSGKNMHSSNSGFDVYINGVITPVNSVTHSSLIGNMPLAYMYVGINGIGQGVYGKVYNFGIFDKALTQNEATELYLSVK